MRYEIDKEILQDLLDSSSHYAEILNKIGGARSGASYRILKNRIERLECDTTKFNMNFKLWKSNRIGKVRRVPMEPFRYGSKTKNIVLKRKLIHEGVKDECSECGQPPEWNGKPLVLHLDHIDGDSKNSVRSNLRILCPHCHTQTNTYGNKNRSGIKASDKKQCVDCKTEICSSSTRCCLCHNKRPKKRKVPNRPSIGQLKEDLEFMTYVAVGEKYGVSDNCIRKWLKSYKT